MAEGMGDGAGQGDDARFPAALRAAADGIRPQLLRWRRHLHAHPELSGQERETAAYIASELSALGLQPQRPLPNAVVCDLGGPGPRVALRADIDALPIREATGLPFASRREGVMHACGHDGHTAILLGVAALLRGEPAAPPLRLLFQPAEEVPPGGARDLIAAGALQDVAAIAGLHLWAPLRSGAAVLTPGPAWAAADRFRARVVGRPGHAAEPHAAVDALEIACRAVVALQSIVSRRIDPLQPAVVTVGRLQAGEAFNVIAGEAVLEGTVRTFDEDVRRAIRGQIAAVLQHTAAAAGARVELEYVDGFPALCNDPEAAAVVTAAAEAQLGAGAVAPGPRAMVADDFARYLQAVPGAYLQLGAGGAAAGLPHHHPQFDIDEDVLPVGVAILADAALRLAPRQD